MAGRGVWRRWWWLALVLIGAGAALSLGSSPAAAGAQPGAPPEQISQIHVRAIVDLSALASAPTQAQSLTQRQPRPRAGLVHGVHSQQWAPDALTAHPSSLGGALAPTSRVVRGGQTRAFNGVSGIDQETGGTGKYAGTGGSLEPPDQGLCSNGSYVIEAVNDALKVYTSAGRSLTPTAILLSQFFHRAAGGTTGPTDFISDPRCVYDSTTHHWFVTVLDLTSVPAYPSFADDQNFIAVSQTGNPMGKWWIYSFDVTDNGQHGSPLHPGCVGAGAGTATGAGCLGDQPTLGVDRYGVYITDNEYAMSEVFPVAPPVVPPLQAIPVLRSGVGQLYALSKQQLISGHNTTLVRFDSNAIPFPGAKIDSPWQSISPATAVPKDRTHLPANGVEYFLSDLGLPVGHNSNRIVVWAWTNTKSLGTKRPNLKLQHVIIKTGHAGRDTFFAPNPSPPASQPFMAYQKPGPHPTAARAGDPEEHLNANDDRVAWVSLSRGTLWTAVNTLLPPSKAGASGQAGQNRVGIMYFQVRPSMQRGHLKATTVRDGYVKIANGSVLFPTVGPRADGATVLTLSLAGVNYFPSMGWARLDGLKPGQAPVVHIAQLGQAPEDGFTGLGTAGQQGLPDVPPCNPCVARWGDYSETEVAPNGCIWGAAEDVHSGQHDKFGAIDWSTGIYEYCPPPLTQKHKSGGHHHKRKPPPKTYGQRQTSRRFTALALF